MFSPKCMNACMILTHGPICIYASIHTYIHIGLYMHAYIRTYMHAYILDYVSISCMHARALVRTHARTPLRRSSPLPLTARTHARACTHTHLPKRTHARTHARARTHTHTAWKCSPPRPPLGRQKHVPHRQRRQLPRRLTVTLTRKLPTRTIADSDGPPAVRSTLSSDPEGKGLRSLRSLRRLRSLRSFSLRSSWGTTISQCTTLKRHCQPPRRRLTRMLPTQIRRPLTRTGRRRSRPTQIGPGHAGPRLGVTSSPLLAFDLASPVLLSGAHSQTHTHTRHTCTHTHLCALTHLCARTRSTHSHTQEHTQCFMYLVERNLKLSR
jgi:hypothetical protein